MDEEDEGQDSITAFGIPEDIHSVPNHNSNITAKRDLNQFGVKFQVYPLLETLDLSDLGPLLYSPQDRSFELLKHLCLKMFTVTREDTRAGFQPMLGKVMVGERDKDYFYEVQEKATLENYATIWAKVLWVGCLAVTNTGRLHERLELTDEQRVGATGLVQDLELLKGARENDDSALQSSALVTVVMFSTHILRQQFEVVNHILPTGESLALQYLVPRALSLLSLRPNGSFLSYLQISHVTAAMRYALRSTVLYRVARSTKPLLLTEDDIDDECARFLAPQKSTSFSYCVQVHAACRRFGQKNQVPTITWATDNF
ncbi:hypothetical protein V1522DRAFT_359142, partial [Lipomyces starkeyi]